MHRWAFSLLLAAALFFAAVPALAGGPALTTMESTGGGALRPAADTAVVVDDERLQLDLREREGLVTATYRLRYTGTQPLDQAMAFPLPPWVMGEWKVSVMLDGTPMAVSATAFPVVLMGGEETLPDEWLDPFSGEPYYPSRVGSRAADPAFVRFDVSFEPGQERELTVAYRQLPGEDDIRLVAPVSRYDYLLQPARHWASFRNLSLEVLVPPGVAVQSNLALTAMGGGRYTASFDKLPDGNLSVFVAPGRGPGWWWRRSQRMLVMGAFALLAGVLSGAIAAGGGWERRRASRLLSFVTMVMLYLLTPRHLFEPGPGSLVAVWFLFLPSLIALHFFVRGGTRFTIWWTRRRAGTTSVW